MCEGFLRKNCERRYFDLNVSVDLRVAVKMIEVFYDPARFAPGFALGIPYCCNESHSNEGHCNENHPKIVTAMIANAIIV